MKRKETNLERIKEVALCFLYQDIVETEFSPLVVIHPIFESVYQPVLTGRGPNIVDILDSENLQTVTEQFAERIQKSQTLDEVYMIIRKSYRLTFLKHVKDYLSIKGMSRILAHAWTTSENPNDDVNVPVKTAVKWFREADTSALMDAEDFKIFEEFPETLKVFRGVAVGKNPKGLSWTTSLDTARWFANRFNQGDKTGYIQGATVSKKDVLAYFNTRNEDEVVVDTSRLKIAVLQEA